MFNQIPALWFFHQNKSYNREGIEARIHRLNANIYLLNDFGEILTFQSIIG
ncbi:MAG: hypothetical protein HN657_05360 [Candidatus Marinimicrobia bacterium]|jgi:hypothetical protein|nr:hypothetical protein [Candidatus Neomarinimicrobiota bacterium]MBT3497033.1 hypothetical protein [Candidatus Neomarinimicrobiota bacterium]MBT3692486.1 hypothetical protein [Candidatus Neomarinimicrobiota bacterium]MBT3731598.1 hypothetical protein [Candidatus Neomarinimicrobiota bacterium]MBT4144732.1 hypothetical protein [Candidatus Neomarinimicrobiota bacterium]